MNRNALISTINQLKAPGKGILAANESAPTCQKRFDAEGIPCSETTRRDYREMLFTTPGIGQYLSGVILYEETLFQKSRIGQSLSQVLTEQGIIPGIKVDKGLVALPLAKGDESVTQGLDGLAERFETYKKEGARFAKWRAVYQIKSDHSLPSYQAICTHAELLARYAAICQASDIVPIVEPEILLDGDYTIDHCAKVASWVLHEVFAALYRHNVLLEGTILKPSMVLSGKNAVKRASVREVAEKTLEVFANTVPAAIPTINFLSGEQTPEEATAHLQVINELKGFLPWNISFSYSRALQEPPLHAWKGQDKYWTLAQDLFLKRAKLNSLANLGKYSESME